MIHFPGCFVQGGGGYDIESLLQEVLSAFCHPWGKHSAAEI